MNAASGGFIGFLKLFAALMGGGFAGVPLSVPPLPEDPVLARVAPDECLAYLTWSGMAAPKAASKNQTEQLLAEPEVQAMFRQIERAIFTAGDNDRPDIVQVREAIRWGKKLLVRPVAAFISSVSKPPLAPGVREGMADIHGGLVINAGDDAAEFKAALEKAQANLPTQAEQVQIGGVSCYHLSFGPGTPPVEWGVKDKYLMAAIGEGSLEGMFKRAR